MVALSKKKTYFVGILVLVLIISVGLHLYDYFIILPKMQATTNDMRAGAFGSWLSDIGYTAYVLETAETNEDLRQAAYYLDSAKWSLSVLSSGIDRGRYLDQYSENPYYWINKATDSLDYAIHQTWSSPALDQYIRLRIENIIQAIRNMRTSLMTSDRIAERPGYEHSDYIGVDLVQQLRDEGKLTDVMNYCRQIHESSIDIADYVRGLQ